MSSETDNLIPTPTPYKKKRSENNLKWIALMKEMKDLGYFAQPMFLDKWMRYRVMTVLINHLAYVLKREPLRVYQAALCRAERTRIGRPYTAFKQARPPKGQEEEARQARGMHVFCPGCGLDLLECGRETRAEVQRAIRQTQQLHTNSTAIRKSKQRNAHNK